MSRIFIVVQPSLLIGCNFSSIIVEGLDGVFSLENNGHF